MPNARVTPHPCTYEDTGHCMTYERMRNENESTKDSRMEQCGMWQVAVRGMWQVAGKDMCWLYNLTYLESIRSKPLPKVRPTRLRLRGPRAPEAG